MKTLKACLSINIAGFFLAILLVSGCAPGGALKNLAPIQPLENLPPEVVLDESNPEQFKIVPRGPILSITQEDVTVAISYWRRADLDRKYNRGNTASPFFETEALHQGEKTDVFYVKITNNNPQPIVYRVKGTRDIPAEIIDQGDNRYGALNYEDLKHRLTFMSRIGGLYVKNGLAVAKKILIEKQIGDPEKGIATGASIEGFIPFQQPKHNAETLEVIIPLEIKPPPGTAARYKRLRFKFPFTHNKGVRLAQPAPIRY